MTKFLLQETKQKIRLLQYTLLYILFLVHQVPLAEPVSLDASPSFSVFPHLVVRTEGKKDIKKQVTKQQELHV